MQSYCCQSSNKLLIDNSSKFSQFGADTAFIIKCRIHLQDTRGQFIHTYQFGQTKPSVRHLKFIWIHLRHQQLCISPFMYIIVMSSPIIILNIRLFLLVSCFNQVDWPSPSKLSIDIFHVIKTKDCLLKNVVISVKYQSCVVRVVGANLCIRSAFGVNIGSRERGFKIKVQHHYWIEVYWSYCCHISTYPS